MEYDSFCRRDDKCTCKICIASIISVLEYTQTTSFSSSPPETPVFFNSSTVSTPESNTPRLIVPHRVNSTRRTWKIKRKKSAEFEHAIMTLMKRVLLLILILLGKFTLTFFTCRIMETKLPREIVRNESLGFEDVKEQLGFLKHEEKSIVGDSTSANPDGWILRSRYQLYASGIEVGVWRWHLQPAGLLTADLDSGLFTILSQRLAEMNTPRFKMIYTVIYICQRLNEELNCWSSKANGSWEEGKWSGCVCSLDEHTWILYYKESFVLGPFCSTMKLLKLQMITTFWWVRQLWRCCDGNHIAPT